MKKNSITKRLSLRAKFKSTSMVEVVIMDEFNNVQIELIPITLKSEVPETKDETGSDDSVKEDE